ncbi:MAG: NAD(P)/FAD-dependent oxidoreductase [Sphaerochaeta sp.]
MSQPKRLYDVVVVGAGIAGLTSAAYLCRSNLKTLVVERSAVNGGLVNSFKKDGFVFDGGIRAFENSGIIFPMLRQLGIPMPIVQNNVTIGLGDDSLVLVNRQSLYAYQDMMQRQFPQRKGEISKIIQEIEKSMEFMDVLYGIDNPLFLDSYSDKDYMLHTLLPWLSRYRKTIKQVGKYSQPIVAFLKQFTDDQSLIDVITQHFFTDTPAFFALSYFGLYLDYCYPLGGTGVLVEKLTSYCMERGADFENETEIVSVNMQEKCVVDTEGRAFGFKKLVWAADQKSLYKAVDLSTLDTKRLVESISKRKVLLDHSKGGNSILSLYVGSSYAPSFVDAHCGAHRFHTLSTKGVGPLTTEAWEKIVKNDQLSREKKRQALQEHIVQYLELTTYEISSPAVRDASLAPEGCCGIILSTLFDYGLAKYIQQDGWYEELKVLCTNTIIGLFEKSLFPAFTEHVVVSLCSTPLSIEKLTNSCDGAITGWSFTNEIQPSVSGFKKIKKAIETPMKDVFQAGQWTFSPSGLPISVLTGKLASSAIEKQLQGKKKKKQ